MTAINSVDEIRPLRNKILVRQYKRPEQVGSVLIPEPLRMNLTYDVWEFVKAHPSVEERFGIKFTEGDILKTFPFAGIYVAEIDNVHYFMIDASAVESLIPWATEAAMEASDEAPPVNP